MTTTSANSHHRREILTRPSLDQAPRLPLLSGIVGVGSARHESETMTITVKIGEAKTHLSDLLAKVEAGEEVIIARGDDPVARLSRIQRDSDVEAVIAEIKAARANRAKTTAEEIRSWRDEGRRF